MLMLFLLFTFFQIESMSDNTNGSDSGGPLWGKFFEDLHQAGSVHEDDTASAISGSHFNEMPTTPSIPRHLRQQSVVGSPYSELQPGDSASAVDEESQVGRNRAMGAASSIAPAPPIDDGTYIFKFKTPSGRTHRFQARNDNHENLRDIVSGKLMSDPFFTAEGGQEGESVHLPDPTAFLMSYTDDDGDLVTITLDGDVADAVKVARSQKSDRVVLVITGDKVWEEAARDVGGAKAVEVLKEATQPAAIEKEEKAMEAKEADPAVEPTFGQSKKVHAVPVEDKVMGIPKEMVLPASIGFLGVIILGVFIATRGGKK